ncbi:putative TIM-barrel fold metal-dependent hydrolase [Spinactinospora alkalitolerans]|uniref:Putative TIM-barrel fold metal-dependent hydrolase n=1 Tax=Spinactinospora alkalitolerans TaxID=687207 RepID=A0A852U1L8_9ACTN|nr:amidohydrolase family protein [Spinactinospora alkalitolerans]NYE49252.1 putative TIM-barrel fold metal-dependent hydrolase [Spinactinospora alkalitolerans]
MFDAHLHIIEPRFPIAADRDYRPPPFTVADYRARVAALGVTGGAVVTGSFHGYDQAHLIDAVRELGPGFVGVAQLPAGTSDRELRDLHAAGVRALRLNLYRGVATDIDALVHLGLRAAELLGWPCELYVDARDLPGLRSRLAPLPRISVDHLGLSREGLPALLDLVASGARVKATGFGRGDLDVPAALRAVAEVNPGALMFGTDLPSTRAPRPFADADRDLVAEVLGGDAAERVLSANALDFYGARCGPAPNSRAALP